MAQKKNIEVVGKKTSKVILDRIFKISSEIHKISDIDILLDKILKEARRFTGAEGGTIFLVEEGKLKVRAIQNDVLFRSNPADRYKYIGKKLKLDSSSIAGHSVTTAESVKLKDAYKKTKDLPCGFNRNFDEKTGYKTKSVLAVPLRSPSGRIIGVLQLVNATNHDEKIKAFILNDELFIKHLAKDAVLAIEKANITREMVLRMLRMVEFRDPKETGKHVNRIGEYAIEIYHNWAEKKGYPEELIRRYKDKLRIAAMLHDVGKIGIPDSILKKPGRLTSEEFDAIKMHSIFGYRMFPAPDSEIDAIAAEIALTHHEKWDGTGYPGKMKSYNDTDKADGKGKKGKEIPLSGRIVAVADVFDALISKRVYKDAWDEDRVLETIKKDSGTHFDPEVTECFFDSYDVISAIRKVYTENN